MQIRDIMSHGVEVIPPHARVQEAAAKMKELDIGSVPVCDGRKMVGVITDRDIAIRLVAAGLDPSAKVSDIMTTDVTYCFEDQDVEEAATLMEVNQIRRLPVVNRDKHLVGIVSLGDLAVRTEGTEDQDLAEEALQEISEPGQSTPRQARPGGWSGQRQDWPVDLNNILTLLAVAGMGAGLMYLLDPQMGGTRRSIARDKMIRAQRKTREAAAVTARDLKNRASGLLAEGKAKFSHNGATDEVLEGRVRSKLGFLVRHPSAIETRIEGGRVILSGPVLADEVDQLISGIRAVRGVSEVENRLQVHDQPGTVPGLQGDKPKPTGQRMDILQQQWSPSTRFLVSTLSGLALGLIAYSMIGDEMRTFGGHRGEKYEGEEEGTAGWTS
jgi:CBS domain-containing protein